MLAVGARRRGDYARATTLFEESNAVCRTGRIVWPTAFNPLMMGGIAVDQGHFDRADTQFRESLTRSWAFGHRRLFAAALAEFAWTAVARGDPGRGARLCGAVDATLKVSGMKLIP